MKKSLLKSIAGWSLFGLGCCHQLVHFMFVLNPEKPQLFYDMVAFKIDFIGEHSMEEFHSGFSLMTGFGLMILGLVIAFLSKIEVPKKFNVLILVSLLTIIITSFTYFHILAYGTSFVVLILYMLSLKTSRKTVSTI